MTQTSRVYGTAAVVSGTFEHTSVTQHQLAQRASYLSRCLLAPGPKTNCLLAWIPRSPPLPPPVSTPTRIVLRTYLTDTSTYSELFAGINCRETRGTWPIPWHMDNNSVIFFSSRKELNKNNNLSVLKILPACSSRFDVDTTHPFPKKRVEKNQKYKKHSLIIRHSRIIFWSRPRLVLFIFSTDVSNPSCFTPSRACIYWPCCTTMQGRKHSGSLLFLLPLYRFVS